MIDDDDSDDGIQSMDTAANGSKKGTAAEPHYADTNFSTRETTGGGLSA